MFIRPCEVSQAVEQSSSWWPAFLKVVGFGRVNDCLPEVPVGLGDVSLVDAGELAICGPDNCWLQTGVCHEDGVACGSNEGGSRCVGVNDPAHGGRSEFVWSERDFGIQRRGGRCDLGIGREPVEDVVIGDGEVDDDFSRGEFVATCYVAVEAFSAVSIISPIIPILPPPARKGVNKPLSALNQTASLSSSFPSLGTTPYH